METSQRVPFSRTSASVNLDVLRALAATAVLREFARTKLGFLLRPARERVKVTE